MEQISDMVSGIHSGFSVDSRMDDGPDWRLRVYIDPLTGLLKDDSPEVRSIALRSLLQIRKAEAAAPKPDVKKSLDPEPPAEPAAREHRGTRRGARDGRARA